MATIAVLGGAGFIGNRLGAALCAGGHTVRAVDVLTSVGSDAAAVKADVRDPEALAAALKGAEVVFNLAAVHRDDVKPTSLYDRVNVAGAVNVCAVCRRLGINRLIFTSSAAVYGPEGTDSCEDQEPKPSSEYGRSKLRAEKVHREWQQEDPGRRSLVIVRPTVVFGEGNRGNVYQLVRQVMARRFIMVGNGGNRKSMAYVGNLCAFLVHVLGLGYGTHLFNYADEPDLSMEELLQIILSTLGRPPVIRARVPYAVGYLGGLACDIASAVTGRQLPVSAVRIRKFCTSTTFSVHRVHATGFRPPIGLREALAKTVSHELRDGDAPA